MKSKTFNEIQEDIQNEPSLGVYLDRRNEKWVKLSSVKACDAKIKEKISNAFDLLRGSKPCYRKVFEVTEILNRVLLSLEIEGELEK